MGYFVQRTALMAVTLLGVMTFSFLIIRIAPGDPALLMLGDYVGVTAQTVADMRAKLGLDEPIAAQFTKFITSVLRGDLGVSFRNNQPVGREVASQIPYTLLLAGAGILVAILIGIPTGIGAAVRRNTSLDYGLGIVSMIWLASPSFWFAILLIYFFAFKLGWFPIVGAGRWGDWAGMAWHLVLPAAAIGLRSAALIARMTRSAVLDVLRQDYVRTAQAKGLAVGSVVRRHVLRNAAIPVVTIIGLDIAYLLGGAVVIESVFARPGLGKLAVDAIHARDYPSVQGATLIFAFGVVLVNFLVDLSYALIDPRIRYA
ncbi:MAG: ABC transporter permease [Armatimonadetes bacterium]|nr:ABC transporter permease [Armatimonadota bacterium]